jgi:hypothetical protein
MRAAYAVVKSKRDWRFAKNRLVREMGGKAAEGR